MWFWGEDGPRTYLTVKFPLLDSDGRAYAVCGISTDITDRKRAEEQVRQLNAELEQRVREFSNMLKTHPRVRICGGGPVLLRQIIWVQ